MLYYCLNLFNKNFREDYFQYHQDKNIMQNKYLGDCMLLPKVCVNGFLFM